jgi:hypothetical protein
VNGKIEAEEQNMHKRKSEPRIKFRIVCRHEKERLEWKTLKKRKVMMEILVQYTFFILNLK